MIFAGSDIITGIPNRTVLLNIGTYNPCGRYLKRFKVRYYFSFCLEGVTVIIFALKGTGIFFPLLENHIFPCNKTGISTK